jgi:hypothetical protein
VTQCAGMSLEKTGSGVPLTLGGIEQSELDSVIQREFTPGRKGLVMRGSLCAPRRWDGARLP